MLKSVFDVSEDLTILSSENCFTFDREIFSFCFAVFWKKVNEYRIEKSMSSGEFLAKEVSIVINKNKADEKVRRKIKDKKDTISATSVLVAALLSQYMSLDVLKPLIPRTSLYRMKRDLKRCGIKEKSFDIDLPTPRLDYLDYLIYFKKIHNRID
jgi:hypothetical protein